MDVHARTRIIGLDLGQAGDPAAAAVVERDDATRHLSCISLRRWTLGTDYCQVVADVLGLPSHAVVVDFTGVGRPVVDVMRREATKRGYSGKIQPVVFAGSNTRAKQKREARGDHWVVPKIDLVTSIVLAQQAKQITFIDATETRALLHELADFRMRITKAANVQFGNKPGGHDDLVCALGLAVWWARRSGSQKLAIYVPGGESESGPRGPWTRTPAFS